MHSIEIIFHIFILILGILVGSFLNVCILRIPLGESVIVNSSHCFSCDKKLKWYELFPIISYIMLGGKCSSCKVHISAQYPIIEAITGLLWYTVFLVYGLSYKTLFGVLLVSVLIVITVIDERTQEIPIQTSVFVGILGIAYTVVDIIEFDKLENFSQILEIINFSLLFDHLLGGLTMFIIFFLLIVLSGGAAMGGGDLKLMTGAGLFLGIFPSLLAFFLACGLGSVIHILRMIFFKKENKLAMGPYLALGVFISFLWGNNMIDWYFAVLGI